MATLMQMDRGERKHMYSLNAGLCPFWGSKDRALRLFENGRILCSDLRRNPESLPRVFALSPLRLSVSTLAQSFWWWGRLFRKVNP